ncbi:unnamed protein product [Gongylonema pulchrum]|uniref:Secreted protein n=1 Tax=Gongylonema pulchrum TaxID=637853 RepID=A0A183DTS2_9BILA|nr:unnamed protein product [Gongylonema pulchrum]
MFLHCHFGPFAAAAHTAFLFLSAVISIHVIGVPAANIPADLSCRGDMERNTVAVTGSTALAPVAKRSSRAEHFADRDRDQNEIIVDGLLDIITNEETCSLNSTSISIDHSRDSVLDFSLCSNPIDEAAVMEQQLAATGELSDNDNDAHRRALTYDSSKDTGASAAVAWTTSSSSSSRQARCAAQSSGSSSSRCPFGAPIASLEDLSTGDRSGSEDAAASSGRTITALTGTFRETGKAAKSREREKKKIGTIQSGNDHGDNGHGFNGDGSGDSASDYHQRAGAPTSTTIKRYIIG